LPTVAPEPSGSGSGQTARAAMAAAAAAAPADGAVATVRIYADQVVDAVVTSVSNWAADEQESTTQNPREVAQWGAVYSAIIAPIESLLALLSIRRRST
jgi:hypothetical protein